MLNGLESLLRGKAPITVEQAYAVLLAGMLPLVLVTGGPGSGKTSTIYAILKVALESEVDPKEIRIAAPTGRAASRVLESLQQRASEDPRLWESMQQVQSSTIHRLLGAGENGFYHNGELPVPARLLVVDELSMVDVTLMGRLLEAVDPERTTLVLLGDPDQLPSVEAGAVLQDFLRIPTDSGPPEIDRVYTSLQSGHAHFPDRKSLQSGPAFSVFLKGSHRFGGSLMEFASELREARIDESSLAARKGAADTAQDLFQGEGVVYIDSAEMELLELLKLWIEIQDENQFGDNMDLTSAFTRLNRTRILSPVRKGPAGVELVNRICGRILKERFSPYGTEDWFAGMPFLLHRNDNVRRIYNGDTGIVGPGRDLLAYFASQQSQDLFSLRAFQRDSLPENEPAFCHTIHKSQGSEYEVVLVLLSGLEGNRAPLNRELIYTAVTRARRKCILYGNAAEIAEASERRIIRETGLAMSNNSPAADV